MNNKKLIIGTACILATAGLSFAAVNQATDRRAEMETVKTALTAGDYSALPETVQARVSEEQFQTMVARDKLHTAEETAIANNDYAAFRTAKIAQIPSETEFAQMVKAQKARLEGQTAMQNAIKNNDFAAFKAAHEAMKTTLDANRPEGAPDREAVAPDETKMKAHFDELVAQYKKDGTLPEEGKGFGRGQGKGGKQGGGRGGR